MRKLLGKDLPRYSLPQTAEQERKGKWSRRVCRPQAKLIRDNQGVLLKFRLLPPECQLAMIHYMAIDGEAWEIPDGLNTEIESHQKWLRGEVDDINSMNAWNAALFRYLPFYVKTYGQEVFGYIASLSLSALCAAVMLDEGMEEWNRDWDAYHRWYMEKAQKHPITNTDWPVIIGSFPDEILQDGWNRFHQYVEMGKPFCRALWYPG
jgi:hypothetical protein